MIPDDDSNLQNILLMLLACKIKSKLLVFGHFGQKTNKKVNPGNKGKFLMGFDFAIIFKSIAISKPQKILTKSYSQMLKGIRLPFRLRA